MYIGHGNFVINLNFITKIKPPIASYDTLNATQNLQNDSSQTILTSVCH